MAGHALRGWPRRRQHTRLHAGVQRGREGFPDPRLPLLCALLQVNVFVLGAVFLQLCKTLRVDEHPMITKSVGICPCAALYFAVL